MKIRILLVLAVLLAVGLGVLASTTGLGIPGLLVKGVLAPFRVAGNALTIQAENIYSYMFRYEALVAENEALRAQVAEMEETARKADSMAKENQRLRDVLEMTGTHEDYKLVDAYIIGWSSTDWSNTLTINRGTDSGIDVGMCAITANGEVVGLVSEVGTNYAVIKTVLDSSLEISATIASTGYNGMVTGGYVSDLDGYLKMDYLPSSSIIRNRDQVVTSGSTVYPRDLILGYVVDAGYEETGVAKFALLEPAVELGSLEQIFVLMAFESE